MHDTPQSNRTAAWSMVSLVLLAGALTATSACDNAAKTPAPPQPAPRTAPLDPLRVLPPDGPSAVVPPDQELPPPVAELPPETPPSSAPPSSEPPAEPPPNEPPPAQPTPPLYALPACTGSVLAAFTVEAIAPPARGSNAYRVPSAARQEAIGASVRALLAGELENAHRSAISAEYSLCRGTGTESPLVLWKPIGKEGQAVFVVRTGEARPTLLEAPHIIFDSGTLEESVVLFDRLKARALIASGTHRCANSESSPCSGTTSACGSTEPYRISDMAHTDKSVFQAAHVALSEHFSEDWVLSIHGMSRSGVSVSDGTSQATSSESPSARIAVSLSKTFSGVTTCNSFGGVPFADHLCGTTSTQGRHLNGSEQACTAAAKTSSRRFVHLEQGSAVRGQPMKVADALAPVLPGIISSASPAIATSLP